MRNAGLRVLAPLFALIASATACGGGGGVSLGDLDGEYVDAYCDRAVRCGQYVSDAACKADLQLNLGTAEQSVEAGRATYDEDLAGECLDAIRGMSCDRSTEDARNEIQACRDAFGGTVADGGVCYSGEECLSETCTIPDCGMACCAGTCGPTVATPAIGQACPNGDCADGAFCSEAGTCVALVAAGGACTDNDACGYGLYCTEAGTCADAPNRGAACPDGLCADLGDRCDATSMTCVALSGRGGACAMGFAGLFDCQRPLACNATTLVCEDPPTVGQACQFFCADGAFCNDANTCEATKANGATCGGDGECSSRFCDDSTAAPVCADVPVCG